MKNKHPDAKDGKLADAPMPLLNRRTRPHRHSGGNRSPES